MSISEKVTEIRKLIELVITVAPELVSLIKELILAIREIKSV